MCAVKTRGSFQADPRKDFLMARIEYHKTGISQDGYEEVVSVELCCKCDSEAEYHEKERGFCEAHYNEYLEQRAEDAAEEKDLYYSDDPEV